MPTSTSKLAEHRTRLWIAALPARALAVARRTRWWPEWEAAGRIWPSPAEAIAAFDRRATGKP